jgi:transcriptional regulator with XRE-family HTH domain
MTKDKAYIEAFARNLRYLRHEREMTLRELSEALGIGKSTLCDYENAKADPTLTTLKKIADYFGKSVDWLVGYTKERRGW